MLGPASFDSFRFVFQKSGKRVSYKNALFRYDSFSRNRVGFLSASGRILGIFLLSLCRLAGCARRWAVHGASRRVVHGERVTRRTWLALGARVRVELGGGAWRTPPLLTPSRLAASGLLKNRFRQIGNHNVVGYQALNSRALMLIQSVVRPGRHCQSPPSLLHQFSYHCYAVIVRLRRGLCNFSQALDIFCHFLRLIRKVKYSHLVAVTLRWKHADSRMPSVECTACEP